MSKNQPTPSTSGIYTSEDGSRYVGGSVRSDGSVRRARKVKPGYVPNEDVPKYVPIGRRRAMGDDTGGVLTKKEETPKGETKAPVEKKPPRRVVDEKPTTINPSADSSSTSETPKEKTTAPVVKKKPPRRIIADESTIDREADSLADSISGLSLDDDHTKKRPPRRDDSSLADYTQTSLDNKEHTDSNMSKPSTEKYIPPWKRKQKSEEGRGKKND